MKDYYFLVSLACQILSASDESRSTSLRIKMKLL